MSDPTPPPDLPYSAAHPPYRPRLVSPDQHQAGWFELIDGQAVRRAYRLIARLADGNYVVHDPSRGLAR